MDIQYGHIGGYRGRQNGDIRERVQKGAVHDLVAKLPLLTVFENPGTSTYMTTGTIS
jgi:hypothetical protein